MATSVHDLDLPELDVMGLERAEALVAIAEARRHHWLARSPLGFVVTSYDDAVAVLRERRFHSALARVAEFSGVDAASFMDGRSPSLLAMEGEAHVRLRRLVAPAFTPAAADRLRPFMREVLTELLDAAAESETCDLVTEVCEPYPVPVICELLGAPREDWKLFSVWASEIFKIFNLDLATDLPAIEGAAAELDGYVTQMVERRRTDPTGDLLSTLIALEEAGDRLSTDELVMLAQSLLLAGTGTTRNQLACSVALLLEHPGQWSLLVERPQLAGGVVEETMRYLGAVRATFRFASQDVVYRDVLFPEGTFVGIGLAGANRDPGHFDGPERLDITRTGDVRHLSFGSGTHHCLGAALARAELEEALGLLARRFPSLGRAGAVEWKPPSFGIWGPASLPVRWR